MERLKVADPRLCLHDDRFGGAGDHGVECAPIARAREWNLETPTQGWAQSRSEAVQQLQVGCVTKRGARWIEADGEIEAHDGREPGQIADRDGPGLTPLDAGDVCARAPDEPGDPLQAVACRDAGIS